MPAIVKLQKCLYGLPQASKYFDEHFSSVLFSLGFKRCISDAQLFILRRGKDFVYLLKHVDDIILASPRASVLRTEVSASLESKYTLTTDYTPSNFVGLAISRDRENRQLTLTQPHYVDTVLSRFVIPSYSPAAPMQEDYLTSMPELDTKALLLPPFQTLFQEKVGSILYLASQSRPDLLYSVTQLSRRSNKATSRDMKAADRLLAYIATTKSLGLTLGSKSGDFTLHAYVDASYNCYPDSKSHTGVSLHLGKDSGCFFALSKRQSIIADSSTVAEYIATHTCIQKLLWAKNVLTELGVPTSIKLDVPPSVVLHQDNTSAINLLKHSGNTGRTKHIDLRYNMIRETIVRHNVQVVYTPTKDMTADILTKPLGPNLFSHHQRVLLNL